MSKILAVLMVILTVSVLSCASIIDGTSQDVKFTSTPEGATIIVDGIERGVTPATISLSKADKNMIVLKKSGFKDSTMVAERKVAGWTFGNLIFGGIVGLAIDWITGAIQRISPNNYHANLLND